MQPLTVMICGRDAEASMAATLDSVDWVDEVLVLLDAQTRDATAAVVERYAARWAEARAAGGSAPEVVLRHEPWRGFTGQKVYGATLARNDWILVVDADEEVSPELRRDIEALDAAAWDTLALVFVRRRNWVMGRPVRAWWPDRQNRLWHRGRVRWGSEALHDRREAEPHQKRHLSGWLEHKRVGGGWSDYFSGRRMDERAGIVARQMHARGKRVGLVGLWLRPAAAFFKFFVIKRGFLDGAFGLLIAQKAAMSVQLKYAALWAAQHGHAPPEPELATQAEPPAQQPRQDTPAPG